MVCCSWCYLLCVDFVTDGVVWLLLLCLVCLILFTGVAVDVACGRCVCLFLLALGVTVGCRLLRAVNNDVDCWCCLLLFVVFDRVVC